MLRVKTKSITSRLRNSRWSSAFLFLLIINFINLSANFHEGNILISGKVDMDDPVDTVSELILEWAMEVGDDLIPDNGTHQDDNSQEKIKLAIFEIPGLQLASPTLDSENPTFYFPDREIIGFYSSAFPPPDRC